MFCDSFCFKWTLTTVGKPGWSLSPAVGQEEQTAANNSSWQLMERRPLREWAREVREVKKWGKIRFHSFPRAAKWKKLPGRTCYCQPQPLETGRKDFSLFSLRRGDFMWFDTILNVVEGSNPRKECSWNTCVLIPLLLWNMWGLAGFTCRTQKYQTI